MFMNYICHLKYFYQKLIIVSMSYDIGTHITFQKKQTPHFLVRPTLFAVGTKVWFYNWLQDIAVLDLSTA